MKMTNIDLFLDADSQSLIMVGVRVYKSFFKQSENGFFMNCILGLE